VNAAALCGSAPRSSTGSPSAAISSKTGTDCYRLAHTKAALAAMTTNQAAQAETLTRRGKR